MALVETEQTLDAEGPVLKSDDEIQSLVEAEIADAVNYDNSLIAQRRQKSIEYYQQYMRDLPEQEGRSKVVSHDLADTVNWMLPDLMEIFMGSTRMVEYKPRRQKDEDSSKQATDYINYVFVNECNGYSLLWDAFWNALVTANGPIKCYWDTSDEEDITIHRGLSEMQYAELVSEDDVEVLQQNAYEAEFVTQEGETFVALAYDCKLKRITSGQLKFEALPPEEFLITRRAQSVDSARFVGHRSLKMRSELVEMGFDRGLVYSLPTANALETDATRLSRYEEIDQYGANNPDDSAEEIELYESYIYCDVDDDGIAERLQVFTAGSASGQLLGWDIWEDEHPFVDLCPMPMPHRWYGRGVSEDTMDIQQVRTVLWRQMLDNLYWSNNPQMKGNLSKVNNPEEVFSPSFGGFIDIDETAPLGPDTVTTNAIPFVADKSYPMFDLLDQILSKRTGVTSATTSLDPDMLQNQNVDAVRHVEDTAQKRVGLIARNFARGGLKRLFEKALRLIVKNQDRPRTVRLRNEWVEVDPRSWNATMDAEVNVGLGTGSKDRDIAALYQVWNIQRQAMEMMGPTHPYTLRLMEAMQNTAEKIVEASGLTDVKQYVPELTEEDMALIAQQAEQARQQPSPEQVMLQVEQMKLQIASQDKDKDRQADLMKVQAQETTRREKSASDERIKVAEIAEREKLEVAKLTLDENARQDNLRMDRFKAAVEAISQKASVITNTTAEEAQNPGYKAAVTELMTDIDALRSQFVQEMGGEF